MTPSVTFCWSRGVALACLWATCCSSVQEEQSQQVDQQDPVQQQVEKTDRIRLQSPQPGATVTNPAQIRGEARGNWYFEAVFQVRIVDDEGQLLGSAPARAQGEWMTRDFVPFKAELRFQEPTTQTGELVLERANPSGLPENAESVRFPIRFP